jgi:hypothetical protein
MRTKVKLAGAESALTRLLDGLERELLEATDEEIIEAARELRMDPQAKLSAAFAGITYPAKPRLQDFFDVEQVKTILLDNRASAGQLSAHRDHKATRRRTAISPRGKGSRKH